MNPTVTDFENYFTRDFPYGTDPNISILTSDVLNAITTANYYINPGLFDDQGSYTIGFLLLAAHYLVTNIRASSQGIQGKFTFLENSKGADGVSSGFAIPERFLEQPYFSFLATTRYGAQYIMNLLPSLCGPAATVGGWTSP